MNKKAVKRKPSKPKSPMKPRAPPKRRKLCAVSEPSPTASGLGFFGMLNSDTRRELMKYLSLKEAVAMKQTSSEMKTLIETSTPTWRTPVKRIEMSWFALTGFELVVINRKRRKNYNSRKHLEAFVTANFQPEELEILHNFGVPLAYMRAELYEDFNHLFSILPAHFFERVHTLSHGYFVYKEMTHKFLLNCNRLEVLEITFKSKEIFDFGLLATISPHLGNITIYHFGGDAGEVNLPAFTEHAVANQMKLYVMEYYGHGHFNVEHIIDFLKSDIFIDSRAKKQRVRICFGYVHGSEGLLTTWLNNNATNVKQPTRYNNEFTRGNTDFAIRMK